MKIVLKDRDANALEHFLDACALAGFRAFTGCGYSYSDENITFNKIREVLEGLVQTALDDKREYMYCSTGRFTVYKHKYDGDIVFKIFFDLGELTLNEEDYAKVS